MVRLEGLSVVSPDLGCGLLAFPIAKGRGREKMEQDIYLSIEDHCDPAFVICSSIFLFLFFSLPSIRKKALFKK